MSAKNSTASAAEVENFRLSQLGDFGIVVNPQWTVSSLQPEDLFLIALEAVQKVVVVVATSAKKSKSTASSGSDKAALISWIKDNANDNAETVYSQAVSDVKTLPKKLPNDAKERFDACSTLSQVLKSVVGVPDHLDYSVFMYPNEKKTRDLITCLLERLADHQDRVRSDQQQGSAATNTTVSRTATGELSIGAIFSRNRNTAAFARPDPRRFIKTSTKAITSIKKPDQVVSTALQENGLRRFAQIKSSANNSNDQQEAPAWVMNHLKALNKNFDEKNGKKQKSAADLMYGSLADVAPQQAAAQERAAAELQAKLRNQAADVEKMKLSVEDAQKARETEDADLSDKLKTLKSGIKHFKNTIKAAKGQMEDLEKEFLALENNETDDLARLEATLAEILSRRAIIDGVDSEGKEFVSTLETQLEEVEADHAGLLKDIASKLNKQKKKQKTLREKIIAMGPTKKEQLQQTQSECKKLGQECRVKLEEYETLDSELEKSKAKTKIKLDREVLSRMIYDVTVRRHAKQEVQIQSLVNEIGLSERRITDLSNAISKRYGEIESDMYSTAQVDAQIRDLFPPLVGLRGEYVNLVKRITELGKVRKETHDFESRLNKLMRFSDSSMLASAERDLQLVSESISSVQKQIEQLTHHAAPSADEI